MSTSLVDGEDVSLFAAAHDHHRMYEKLGRRLIAINGVPAWIPPPWIDPDQRPMRNPRVVLE